MLNKKRTFGLLALLASLGFVTACGNQVAGGGLPTPQPITTQPGNNLNNSTPASSQTGTGGGQSNSGGGTGTGSSSKGSTSSGSGKSTTASTSTTGKSGATSGSTGTTATGTTQTGKTQTNKPVTVQVQGILPALVSTPVASSGADNGFVAVSSSIQSVLLPAGWTLSNYANGADGMTVRLTNPKDSSQTIVEDIQTSSRDIEGFYSGQAAGQVQWLIPKQVVQFTFQNPNNPNPDVGIIGNISSGGSIRLDLYLPSSEKGLETQIIHSFVSQ